LLTQVVSSYRPRFGLLMSEDDILARAYGQCVQGAQPHGLDLDHLPTGMGLFSFSSLCGFLPFVGEGLIKHLHLSIEDGLRDAKARLHTGEA